LTVANASTNSSSFGCCFCCGLGSPITMGLPLAVNSASAAAPWWREGRPKRMCVVGDMFEMEGGEYIVTKTDGVGVEYWMMDTATKSRPRNGPPKQGPKQKATSGPHPEQAPALGAEHY
jgi:hypothetical protein